MQRLIVLSLIYLVSFLAHGGQYDHQSPIDGVWKCGDEGVMTVTFQGRNFSVHNATNDFQIDGEWTGTDGITYYGMKLVEDGGARMLEVIFKSRSANAGLISIGIEGQGARTAECRRQG